MRYFFFHLMYVALCSYSNVLCQIAGVGYPQLSAVIECADAAHGLGGIIISVSKIL